MLLLLGGFVGLLLLGAPIAFCLFGSSALYFFVCGMDPIIIVQRILAGPNSFTLLAIPGFILAAAIMNTGGITERIFKFADTMVGHITGGLGHANILASIIFAGMSGAAIADIAGLGAIELKAMKKAGYDDDFSLAITGASSLVGPIIPPSIPAVLFAVAASESVGRLFIAGVVPGVLLSLSMSIYVYIQCKRMGYHPGKRASFKERLAAFSDGFLSLLTPIFIVVSIVIGICTPTEAAMIALVYAIVLSIWYRSLTLSGLIVFIKETILTTTTTMCIVASASIFGWILAFEQIPQKLVELFIHSIDNRIFLLIFINIFLLLVGCFMESSSAILILTPVFLPLMASIGMDPVHFGIIMILNLMIGLLTPPVGMGLFTLSTVSGVPFEHIAAKIAPYIILDVAMLMLFTFCEPLVMFLPNLLLPA